MYVWLSIQPQTQGDIPPSRFLELFLNLAPSCLVHCPAISASSNLSPSLQFSNTTIVGLGFPLPAPWAGKCLRAEI